MSANGPKRTFERLPFDAVISDLTQRLGERLDGDRNYLFIETRIAYNGTLPEQLDGEIIRKGGRQQSGLGSAFRRVAVIHAVAQRADEMHAGRLDLILDVDLLLDRVYPFALICPQRLVERTLSLKLGADP